MRDSTLASVCVLLAVVDAAAAISCATNLDCTTCAAYSQCYWCEEAKSCRAIVGSESATCTVTSAYWRSCSVNALVVLVLTGIGALLVTVCVVCTCCWCSRWCQRRRVNSILREQHRADLESTQRHGEQEQRRTERQAVADRIRVRYGERICVDSPRSLQACNQQLGRAPMNQ